MGIFKSKHVYISTANFNGSDNVSDNCDLVTVCMENIAAGGLQRSESRKNEVTKFISLNSPCVVFFQHFLGKGPYAKPWNGFPFPNKYMYYGNQKVSILYDMEQIKFEDISRASENILDKIHVVKHHACVFKAQFVSGEGNFIGVSWSGPHSGYTDEHKLSLFIEMLSIFEEISLVEELPVIVGGVFRIDMETAKTSLPKNFVLYECENQGYRFSENIGFFLSSKKIRLVGTEQFLLDALCDGQR